MLFQDRFERALLATMAQLDAIHVVWSGCLLRGDSLHLVRRNKEKLRFRVNELLDEPGAGDPIDLHLLACHPLHDFLPQPRAARTLWLGPEYANLGFLQDL